MMESLLLWNADSIQYLRIQRRKARIVQVVTVKKKEIGMTELAIEIEKKMTRTGRRGRTGRRRRTGTGNGNVIGTKTERKKGIVVIGRVKRTGTRTGANPGRARGP
eukprot:749349-Hanusia_phi.AAC.2